MSDSKPVILWIDDEEAQLQLFAELLSREGYRVLTATHASAAFHLFETNRVDLVVSDQKLRDCPGVEVLAEMKRIKPSVSVMLFSGAPEPEGATLADMCLTKGVCTTQDLLAGIAKLLKR